MTTTPQDNKGQAHRCRELVENIQTLTKEIQELYLGRDTLIVGFGRKDSTTVLQLI